MTREGIPVAHQVFPGNTADIDTFKTVIADTRRRFQLRRVIFVGDRGMVSPALLDELDHEHIEYIVGVKMRKMKAVVEAERDRQAREEMIKKLEEKLKKEGPKQLIGNSGYRRYLVIKKETAEIDYARSASC